MRRSCIALMINSMNNVSYAASLKCNFCENVELGQLSSLCLFNFPHCFLQQMLQRQWKCIRWFQFIWLALILCYWIYCETKTMAETANALKNFYPMITSSKKIPALPISLEPKMVLMNMFLIWMSKFLVIIIFRSPQR